MAAASQQYLKSKSDQIVQDFFFKSIQVILQSRIPRIGQSSAEATTSSSSSRGTRWDRRFNLASRNNPTDADILKACKTNRFSSVVLDILLVKFKHQQTGNGDQPGAKHGKLKSLWEKVSSQNDDHMSVLERWILQYRSHDNGQNEQNHTSITERVIARLCKSTMILLRSLCSMTRLLPAHRAFEIANSSSYGKLFSLSYRFLPLPRPFLHEESVQMNSYKFTPIDAPFGKICLSVDYHLLMASDLNVPSGLRFPIIITNYKGNPSPKPIKKLSNHCSRNMMPNFSGYLPPDSYRDKWLNDRKCASTVCGHSSVQRALLMSSSCKRPFRCIGFSSEEQFQCTAQFARQANSSPGSLSVGNASLAMCGACNDYQSEAEVINLSLPFAIDSHNNQNFVNRFTSSQSPQINDMVVKLKTASHISVEAAVGSLVQLLKFAPPLQRVRMVENSQKDGNILNQLAQFQISQLPLKNLHLILANSPSGETSSFPKVTLSQTLKELDKFKDIKNRILNMHKK